MVWGLRSMEARTVLSWWTRFSPLSWPADTQASAGGIVRRKGLGSQAKPPIMLEPVTTCHPYRRGCTLKKGSRLFYRVVSTLAPRLAPGKPASGEKQASCQPVPPDRLVSVIGTRGVEPAGRRKQRRHNLLVRLHNRSRNARWCHLFRLVPTGSEELEGKSLRARSKRSTI